MYGTTTKPVRPLFFWMTKTKKRWVERENSPFKLGLSSFGAQFYTTSGIPKYQLFGKLIMTITEELHEDLLEDFWWKKYFFRWKYTTFWLSTFEQIFAFQLKIFDQKNWVSITIRVWIRISIFDQKNPVSIKIRFSITISIFDNNFNYR